jgi:hypothetical protein
MSSRTCRLLGLAAGTAAADAAADEVVRCRSPNPTRARTRTLGRSKSHNKGWSYYRTPSQRRLVLRWPSLTLGHARECHGIQQTHPHPRVVCCDDNKPSRWRLGLPRCALHGLKSIVIVIVLARICQATVCSSTLLLMLLLVESGIGAHTGPGTWLTSTPSVSARVVAPFVFSLLQRAAFVVLRCIGICRAHVHVLLLLAGRSAATSA